MLNLCIFMKIEYLIMIEKNPMSMKFCPNLSAWGRNCKKFNSTFDFADRWKKKKKKEKKT